MSGVATLLCSRNVTNSVTSTSSVVVTGTAVVAASTMESTIRDAVQGRNKADQATAVGKTLAERAKQQGITEVVFDRGGYKYHGRVKALAEAAREGGLTF